MPPEDESKMTSEERKIVVDHLGSVIRKIETTAANKTGPTVIRRLTNYEYDNTVKTITGLDLNLARNFPADGGGGEGFVHVHRGFFGIGDVLSQAGYDWRNPMVRYEIM